MKKDILSIILVCAIIGIIYLAAQVEFLQYYQVYKKPFGRVDVDNYFDTIYDKPTKTEDTKARHIMIYAIGKIARLFDSAEIVFTFLIPFVSCIIMTLTVFIFLLYFTRDSELSLLGIIFYIFGTYSMQAFMISAYWAQLFATIGMLLFIIFYEEYMLKKARICLIICIMCAIYLVIAHIKFVGAIPLYLLARMLVKKEYKIVIGIMIALMIGWAIFPTILVSTYPVPMGVDYVFTKFLFPLFWFIVAAYMMTGERLTNYDKTFFIFTILIFIVSSFSALWRPLISALPIFIYFVVKYYDGFRKERKIYYGIVIFTILLMSIYFYYTTSYALSSMIGEMIPGVFNTTYRNMDPGPLLHMFGGSTSDIAKFNITKNQPIHRVDGFISITGHAVETDVIINGTV